MTKLLFLVTVLVSCNFIQGLRESDELLQALKKFRGDEERRTIPSDLSDNEQDSRFTERFLEAILKKSCKEDKEHCRFNFECCEGGSACIDDRNWDAQIPCSLYSRSCFCGKTWVR